MNAQLEAFISEIQQIPGFEAHARAPRHVNEIESTFHAIQSAAEHSVALREVLDALLSTIASKGGNERRVALGSRGRIIQAGGQLQANTALGETNDNEQRPILECGRRGIRPVRRGSGVDQC
jgi:hypothetical protein